MIVLIYVFGFPRSSMSKDYASSTEDLGLIPGSGRSPGEGNGNPLPVLLPGKSHGWRSLVGYSSWVRKESDTTEQLHFVGRVNVLNFISQIYRNSSKNGRWVGVVGT